MAAVVSKIDLERLASDLVRASNERKLAREAAVRALRLIESKVVDAIGGDTLRGMQNLAPPWHAAPYYAQRVHSGEGVRFRGLPKGGHPVLVISKRGTIALARVAAEQVIDERDVLDEELQLEDLEPVACAFVDVVERHAERLERGAEVRARVTALAERLLIALRG